MMFTVLGGSGNVGSNLVRRLRELGHEVCAPPRGELATNLDFGHVIYAIGVTADFRTRPFDTIESHVSTVANFLRNARFQSFLYLSSTRIYANSLDTDENSTLQICPSEASDLYNISKLAGEAICLNSGKPNVKIARLSNVVGRREANAQTFLGAICREAYQGRIRLQTGLESTKDYIWIDDVTDLLIKICQQGKRSIYNVASGYQVSHKDWLSAISARTGCTYEVEKDARCISFSPISTRRIVSEFGFRATFAPDRLDEILEQEKT
jgi:nucleoside-diphosphate-sugar epimerase